MIGRVTPRLVRSVVALGVLKDLVRTLYPFDYSIVGKGNDDAASLLTGMLDFQVLEWPSGSELNGWLVPPAMTVECAEISLDGEVVYDGKTSPLGVPAQSDSFSGEVGLDELLPHLFSDPELPDAIPAHWSKLYRPSEPLWGFCMPDRLRKSLRQGTYDVKLVTRREPGTMKVFLFELPGQSRERWLFNAHNCHPFQANDDMSGVAVGIGLMQRLAAMPKRYYTYQLLVAPELFGPIFWLDSLSQEEAGLLRGTVMLKSVGNGRPLRLQRSFDESSLMCRAGDRVFKERFGTYDAGPFRGVYGNDETVFEAPPFQVPSITLTRWPFAEYHTDLDTPDQVSEASLQDCVDTALSICRVLEMDRTYVPTFRGLVSLSSHGLYRPTTFSASGVDYGSVDMRWFRLMNTLPSLLGAGLDLLSVAEDFDLPIDEVHDYVMRWVAEGLVEIQ